MYSFKTCINLFKQIWFGVLLLIKNSLNITAVPKFSSSLMVDQLTENITGLLIDMKIKKQNCIYLKEFSLNMIISELFN